MRMTVRAFLAVHSPMSDATPAEQIRISAISIAKLASIDGEQDTEEIAIAACELEMIGAPTDIRARSDHDTVVGAPWPAASVPLQGQFVDLMIRSARLALIVGLPSAFCCRFTKRVMRRYP
jgi:hypothetical protein